MTFAAWQESAARARRWIRAVTMVAFLVSLFTLGYWGGAHDAGTITTAVFWAGLGVYIAAYVAVMAIHRAQHQLYTFERAALEAAITAKNDQLSALLVTVADWERMKRAQGSAVQ